MRRASRGDVLVAGWIWGTAHLLAGCSASAPAASPDVPLDSGSNATREPPEGYAMVAAKPTSATRTKLPEACEIPDADVCTPPPDFAESLCQTRRPGVALALFHKDSPWTRAWVRQPMEAWYASGGRSGKHQLRYAEEVLVVAKREHRGGIQVSGSGSFDVVRWDGSCVSLMEGELSFRRPREVDVAVIPWKRLDADTRQLLRGDQLIGVKNDRRIEACKDDKKAKKCERAMLGLSRIIANYVRGGGEVPRPKILP